MEASKALALLEAREGSSSDRWSQVKAGGGSFVEELSTAQEWALLGLSSDISTDDPADVLAAFERGDIDDWDDLLADLADKGW
jgi:hypothetical protein